MSTAKRDRLRWWLKLWGPVWIDRSLTVIAVGLASWSVIALNFKADRAELRAARAQQTARQQQQGRKTAIEAVCGIEQATIDAGRAQLLKSGDVAPLEFERNLERIGYPPRKVRERQAQVAARSYSSLIAQAVERESGVKGIVVGGRLDCRHLVSAANAAR